MEVSEVSVTPCLAPSIRPGVTTFGAGWLYEHIPGAPGPRRRHHPRHPHPPQWHCELARCTVTTGLLSAQVLPGITRQSVVELGRGMEGVIVQERTVTLPEVPLHSP